MHNDKVCNIVGFAGLNKRSNLVVSSVHALGSREHQLYLLSQMTKLYIFAIPFSTPVTLHSLKKKENKNSPSKDCSSFSDI